MKFKNVLPAPITLEKIFPISSPLDNLFKRRNSWKYFLVNFYKAKLPYSICVCGVLITESLDPVTSAMAQLIFCFKFEIKAFVVSIVSILPSLLIDNCLDGIQLCGWKTSQWKFKWWEKRYFLVFLLKYLADPTDLHKPTLKKEENQNPFGLSRVTSFPVTQCGPPGYWSLAANN